MNEIPAQPALAPRTRAAAADTQPRSECDDSATLLDTLDALRALNPSPPAAQTVTQAEVDGVIERWRDGREVPGAC